MKDTKKQSTLVTPTARCNNSSGCPLGNRYIVIAIGGVPVVINFKDVS
jgi:hypothetical protein